VTDPGTDVPLSELPPDCSDEKECENIGKNNKPKPTFRPFSDEELNKFLEEFKRRQGNEDTPTRITTLIDSDPFNNVEENKEDKFPDKPKASWHLIQSQTHKHPYDDHTGWVTLEPVPWSSSHIQKWEPNANKKPEMPSSSNSWDNNEQPWNKPNKWNDRPWNKPTYEYKPSSKPSHWSSNNYQNYNKPQWQDSWASSSDIITDGKPGLFPQDHQSKPWSDSFSHRPATEVVYHGYKDSFSSRPSSPPESDGRWVLLSSTKGYSVPHRNRGYQRALNLNSNLGTSVSSHRTVRLTVLPALNGTTNTTTSHGGLLEVEETSQTVDEAQREHAAKMLRLENDPYKSVPKANKRSGAATRVYPLQTSTSQSRSNAVLAAVGAGMIPATVAMLLPMVLGRKKRDLQEDHFYSDQLFHLNNFR
jgi:hypothetical protein